MSEATVAMIPTKLIRENAEALRTVDRGNQQYLDLSASIASKGILNPILLRPVTDPTTGEQYYGLVDGLQRLTSLRDTQGNEGVIPALIKDQNEMDVLTNQVVTNALRVETKPVEYTRQIQRLMEMDPLLTIPALAVMLTKSEEWVKARLGLLQLIPEAAELVDEGLINVTNAYALSKLPTEVQPDFLDRARELPYTAFVPQVTERKKDLDKARREGRAANPEVFSPEPKPVKLGMVQAALADTSMISTFIEAEGAATPLEGAVAALKWAISLDKKSVEAQQAAYDAKQAAMAEKKAVAELEKAKRAEAVQDFKARRAKLQLQLTAKGVSGDELEAQLAEFDKLNAPAKKAEKAAAAVEADADAKAAKAEAESNPDITAAVQ